MVTPCLDGNPMAWWRTTTGTRPASQTMWTTTWATLHCGPGAGLSVSFGGLVLLGRTLQLWRIKVRVLHCWRVAEPVARREGSAERDHLQRHHQCLLKGHPVEAGTKFAEPDAWGEGCAYRDHLRRRHQCMRKGGRPVAAGTESLEHHARDEGRPRQNQLQRGHQRL